MLRDLVQLQNAYVVEIRNIGQPLDRRDACRQASVDDNQFSSEGPLLTVVQRDSHLLRTDKRCFSVNQVDELGPLQAFFAAFAPFRDHCPFSLANREHVHRHVTNPDSIIHCPASHVSQFRAGDECLGWGAAVVDAGAADKRTFNNRRALAFVGQCAR